MHPLGATIQCRYPTASQSHGRLGKVAAGRIMIVFVFSIECRIRIHSFVRLSFWLCFRLCGSILWCLFRMSPYLYVDCESTTWILDISACISWDLGLIVVRCQCRYKSGFLWEFKGWSDSTKAGCRSQSPPCVSCPALWNPIYVIRKSHKMRDEIPGPDLGSDPDYWKKKTNKNKNV